MKTTRVSLLRHGLLALPIAFAGLPIYIHVPDFYATELGLSLASIGFTLLLLRIIDAVQDPLIGSLSDRFHQHRKFIMVLGVAMLGGGFWMVFHPLNAFPLLWLALSILICTTGFSIASINLQATGGLWRVDAHDRTRVAGTREALGLIGLLAASVMPAILMQQYPAALAFHLITLGYLPLLAACAFIFYRWSKHASLAVPLAAPHSTLSVSYRDLWQSSWVRRFMAVYGLSTFASSIPGVLVLFFIRDHLQVEEQTGLFLFLYFLSGAAAMPVWQHIVRKRSKNYAWGASMILACVTFVWAFLLEPGDSGAFAVVCLLSGIAFGADLALPPAIIADHIASTHRADAAARYYSLLAFCSKGALALATGLALPLLAWAGYQPGQADTTGTLPIAYALIPCVIKVSSALLLIFSPVLAQGEFDEEDPAHPRSSHVA